jgi:hypothetical protein
VVFDEIDAICRPRGLGGDQAVGMVYDGLVNQARTASYFLVTTHHPPLTNYEALPTTTNYLRPTTNYQPLPPAATLAARRRRRA